LTVSSFTVARLPVTFFDEEPIAHARGTVGKMFLYIKVSHSLFQ
jgi:hypothetical protein